MIETVLQYEANIDDMDPRLWPHVIEQLLSAGALDAWATPILMKKGRPAFTLGAMCHRSNADTVRSAFFRETTTIGLRESELKRHVLDRSEGVAQVQGAAIRTKSASDLTGVQNISVEWDDVAAAALELGLSAKDVLALATAATWSKD